MTSLHVPKQACTTCPYRRDTPSGIWDSSEYVKLLRYDDQFDVQLAIFQCHQSHATGRRTVCRGWLSCHRDHPSIRLGVLSGSIRPEDLPTEAELLYYASGAEACLAGLAELHDPGDDAKQAIDRLLKKGIGKVGLTE